MYKKSITAFGEEKSKHQYKLWESSGKPILQIENSKLARGAQGVVPEQVLQSLVGQQGRAPAVYTSLTPLLHVYTKAQLT